MERIQGVAAHAAGSELLPFHYDPGELGPMEVEIGITHCGICHSDLHLIANDWGISQYPFIPGHEIVGAITALGADVKSLEVGQRVGLGWQSNSCGTCEWCTRGMENLCPLSEATCIHRHGGYADRVRANARFVIPIPESMESAETAPLLCGGITVYNPLRSHGINPTSRAGELSADWRSFTQARSASAQTTHRNVLALIVRPHSTVTSGSARPGQGCDPSARGWRSRNLEPQIFCPMWNWPIQTPTTSSAQKSMLL